MRTQKLATIAAGVSFALLSLNSSIAMALDGATLYQTKTCIACHGVDAKTPLLPTYPKLAGQNKEYTVAQMAAVKSGARDNGQTAVMKGIMHIINDAEREAIAEWLASLPRDNVGNADAEGAKLYYDKQCSTCHGTDAKTPVLSSYPKLAGQNKDYALAQMKDIKNSTRNNGHSTVMKAFMDQLEVNEADMETIAGWLAGN